MNLWRWLLDRDRSAARCAAERRRWGSLRFTVREETAVHAADCPIADCTTCQTAALAETLTPICQPPSHRGRAETYREAVLDVAGWLRCEIPDLWWTTDQTKLCRVAAWLLDLRQQVEEGKWKP